jgi:hypothetical protein
MTDNGYWYEECMVGVDGSSITFNTSDEAGSNSGPFTAIVWVPEEVQHLDCFHSIFLIFFPSHIYPEAAQQDAVA